MSLTTSKYISFGSKLGTDFRVGWFSSSTLSSRPAIISTKCCHWYYRYPQAGKKMTTVVLGKTQIFSEENGRSFLPHDSRSQECEIFFPKALLQNSLHTSQGRITLHALLELVIDKRNRITFTPIRSISGSGVKGALRHMAVQMENTRTE